MSILRSLGNMGRAFATKLLAAGAAAKASANASAMPDGPEPLRINPVAALRPRQRPLTGPELAYVRTQKRDGLTYRAGRSKYAPKELKDAVQRVRQREAEGGYRSYVPFVTEPSIHRRLAQALRRVLPAPSPA